MAISNQTKQSAILWGLAALALSIVTCTFNNSGLVLSASLFAKIMAVCAGTIAGTLGALIGDALRRAVHPDMVFTNGGFFSLLGIKLFWMAGPQLIGLGIGTFLAITLVLK